MFVPIRRDPPIFRESYSDASALQKNVNYSGSSSLSFVEIVVKTKVDRMCNCVVVSDAIYFRSNTKIVTDGREIDQIN